VSMGYLATGTDERHNEQLFIILAHCHGRLAIYIPSGRMGRSTAAESREWGICLKRDSWVSVMSSEKLDSAKSAATRERTDRHGIVGQKRAAFPGPW
jgi:hypothetical protein